MNAVQIADLVLALLKGAPIAIRSIADAKPFAVDLWRGLTGREPSEMDDAALDAALAALSARLAEPLSAAQPGDPDYLKG